MVSPVGILPDSVDRGEFCALVRCSDGKLGPDSSDPNNACGDATPNDGKCPGDRPPNRGDDGNRLQAFSDLSSGRYSRITFCTGFFNHPSFTDAVNQNMAKPKQVQNNLDNWENRARCFFHEITHLDYFMNAGDNSKSPFVSDLEVEVTAQGNRDWHHCYGSYYSRILTNWLDKDPKYIGYFTQRNADNYALFALANYVQSKIGFYPTSPRPGRKRPLSEPRDSQTHEPPSLLTSTETQDNENLRAEDELDPPGTLSYPGCSDRVGPLIAAGAVNASLSAQYAHPSPTATCSFVTTTWQSRLPSMSSVACFCSCDSGAMVLMTWGTSATATSSWCLPGPGDYAPSGWAQITGGVSYCTGLPGSAVPPAAATPTPPRNPAPDAVNDG
ncbi:MAG: hypothetical protein M1829_001001 [Trizodia sp. TS-e1964]|nr:MAG: hypothetical protein M1829_001001 [Trizodia sp. TS-e1964]